MKFPEEDPTERRSRLQIEIQNIMDARDKFDPSGKSRLAVVRSMRPLFFKLAVLLMLVLVMGLSTLAKNTGYLPDSNPAHYISSASKMSRGQSPAILDQTPVQPISRLIPHKATSGETHRNDPQLPPNNQIVLISSLQHRSPPVLA
jgi:hypothetical protein